MRVGFENVVLKRVILSTHLFLFLTLSSQSNELKNNNGQNSIRVTPKNRCVNSTFLSEIVTQIGLTLVT